MDEEELKNHRLTLKVLEKYLNFIEASAHEEEVVDEEDDE
jgi:hypothetical protein